MKKEEKHNVLKEKSFTLAIRIVKLHRYLVKEKNEWTLSKQLLKSGTNPGAMVREAQNAESDADFIHKLGIAQKEADETMYWLELLHKAEILTYAEFISIHNDALEILKLTKSIILSKKTNMLKNKALTIIVTLVGAWTTYSIF
jgi:four helix bundle protein